jgi:hypothetical protein
VPAKAEIHENGVLQNHSSKAGFGAPAKKFFSSDALLRAVGNPLRKNGVPKQAARTQTPATATLQAGNIEKQ